MDFKSYKDNGNYKRNISFAWYCRSIRFKRHHIFADALSDICISVAFWNGLCIGIYKGNYGITERMRNGMDLYMRPP